MKFLSVAILIAFSSSAFAKNETRCGWISNPTPANYWIDDADGEWIISVQGGYSAKGDIEAYPSDDQMVRTNGHYGYWCGCITGSFDRKQGKVIEIVSSTAKNLNVCMEDPNLQQCR